MNKITLTFAALLITLSSAFSQLKTGDTEFDGILKDINTIANVDLPLFKKDIGTLFNIPVTKIDDMLNKFEMKPADVVMALEISKQTNKTPDQVAESFKVNKDKGWGEIAKEMGIKPGSPEFHALKNSAKGKNEKLKEKNKGKGKDKEKGKGKGNGGKKK